MSPTIQVESGLNEPGPDGGNWEHLDESRREIVHLCGKKGITLFTFLLQSATIKHVPGQGEVAVFEPAVGKPIAERELRSVLLVDIA